MEIVHKPVMLKETLSFIPKGTTIAIDTTLGEGGHTLAMLEMGIEVHAFERDKEILNVAKERLSKYNNIHYYNATYDKITEVLPKTIIGKVNFILYDLGVSLYHFKKANRGFSFKDESKLDMRLGINDKSAFEVINKYSISELTRVFKEYGEIKNAGFMAKIIVENRNIKPIENTKELENIIFHHTKKDKKYGKIHPATQAFQAIRIEVNDELNILEKSLKTIPYILSSKGVAAIISYHSLEDRIVKTFFKENEKTKNKDGIFNLLNSKVITPTNEEIDNNPASRSAKMRIGELISGSVI